ncbi:MAG: VWA domain-containing protein [Planctomycetota bacterium]
MIALLEIAGLSLLDPWFLAGIPVSAAVVALAIARKGAALPSAFTRPIERLPSTARERLVHAPLVLKGIGASILCVALARPVERQIVPRKGEGVDIVLLVDISSSMQLNDMDERRALRRVDAARKRASEFAAARKDDRLGLVTFSRFAELRCPLTLDHEALATFLAAIDTVPQNSELDGTAIGTALAKAAKVLDASDAKSKVVVLLTDGENNLGDIQPAEGTKLCADSGIRVYTIGLGNGLPDVFGGWRPSDFSELQRIASETGGSFYTARSDEDLRDVYAEIDRLEKAPIEDPRYRTTDRYERPLVAGLLAVLLAVLLEISWLGRAP